MIRLTAALSGRNPKTPEPYHHNLQGFIALYDPPSAEPYFYKSSFCEHFLLLGSMFFGSQDYILVFLVLWKWTLRYIWHVFYTFLWLCPARLAVFYEICRVVFWLRQGSTKWPKSTINGLLWPWIEGTGIHGERLLSSSGVMQASTSSISEIIFRLNFKDGFC